MQDKILLAVLAVIVVVLLLAGVYIIDNKKEEYPSEIEPAHYPLNRAYINENPFVPQQRPNRRYDHEVETDHEDDVEEYTPERAAGHATEYGTKYATEYNTLDAGYKDTSVVAPQERQSIYDNHREPMHESIAPKESGTTFHRTAFKMGPTSRSLRGSYGVGYTDERGIC